MSTSTLPAVRGTAWDYLALTKPRITLMVMLTTWVGYVVASRTHGGVQVLVPAILGTGLVAAGASALNMLLERRIDARMLRTATRPLPAGRLRPLDALFFGLALTSVGLAALVWLVGTWAAALALLTWSTYLFLYTPLKTRSSMATLVGAIPGALPPVIGWAAACGRPDPGAFLLFAILFLWQIPHFLAIAWMYRDDYARAGLPTLPVLDPDGRLTGRQAVAHCLVLLVVSLIPAAAGLAGPVYLAGAAVLGIAFTAVAVWAAVVRTLIAARRLFLASVSYLAALCTLLLVGR